MRRTGSPESLDGGQQTFGDLEARKQIFIAVLEFPLELSGWQDGEGDVAIERRTDEGEDDCDRG